MTAAEIALRLVGAFYMFAGYFLARVILTSRIADQAIEALTGEATARAVRLKTVWSLALGGTVFASGLALLLLLELAVTLFLTGSALQAFYLVWLAPKYFDPVDGADPQGRKQTTNALIVYGAATLGVLWAWQKGLLLDWFAAPYLTRLIAGSGMTAFLGYVLWGIIKTSPELTRAAKPARDEAPREVGPADPANIRKLRVMAVLREAPLFCMDDDNLGHVTPEALGLSEELTRDLWAWSTAYTKSLEAETASDGRWDDADYSRHFGRGHDLAERLANERRDLEVHTQTSDGNLVRVEAAGAA